MMAKRELDKRLRDVSFAADGTDTEEASILRKMAEGPMPGVDKFMKQSRSGSWLTRLIEQSGVQTTPSAIILVTVMSAGILGLVTALLFPGPTPPLAALVGAFPPFGFLMNCRTRRLNRFEEQFPEALDCCRAPGAGHAFQTATGMVADDLSEPVGPSSRRRSTGRIWSVPLARP
jgi:tight adherence protein B